MSDILCVNIGETGCEIGQCCQALVSALTQEHCINHLGYLDRQLDDVILNSKRNIYFDEVKDNCYKPRSIFIDVDPCTCNDLLNCEISALLTEDSIVSGYSGSNHSYAEGYALYGYELKDLIQDRVRTAFEKCDSIDVIQIYFSSCGGTGSGVTSLVLTELQSEFKGKIIQSFCVLPSKCSPLFEMEYYNTIFALERIIEYSSITHLFDFESCYNFTSLHGYPLRTSSKDFSKLISECALRITSSIRFPGSLSFNLRKMTYDLVAFPRDHFTFCSIESLYGLSSASISTSKVIEKLFSKRSTLCSADPNTGKFFAAHGSFIGKLSNYEVEFLLSEHRRKNIENFMDWMPCNLTSSLTTGPNPNLVKSLMIGNSTAIKSIFSNICESFSIKYRKRQFLYHFEKLGISNQQFIEAESNVCDLISDLNAYEAACIEEEYEYEY